MKIVHILSQLYLTGSEVYAKDLIEHQTKEGHDVYLLSDNINVTLA